MYIVGQAYPPTTDSAERGFTGGADFWELEIHDIQDIEGQSHWACIQIYAETLDLCLLKAKTICDILNSDEFTIQITGVLSLTKLRIIKQRNVENKQQEKQ